MDICNILILRKQLGEMSIFSADFLNSHLTLELQLGKSPSTIQSRLYYFRRFIQFVKIHNPNLLPNRKRLNILLTMIMGIGTSLTKLKSKRQQDVMMKNRENFPKLLTF